MKSVAVKVDSADKASRVELFVRIVWSIICSLVLFAFGIIACICLIIQWFFILITGTRNQPLNNIIKVFFYYHTKYNAYTMLLTDERNPILPED